MFVPRSARRIRFARAAFALAGFLPCIALGAWAVHRHSAGHRDAIRRAWEEAVGLPIVIASVEHPLPGAVRARGCALAAADGGPVLAAGVVRVETAPAEVRLAVDAIDCDPAGAAVLAGLAGDWLRRGVRFRRDVVIDVADVAWTVADAAGRRERHAFGPVRIECVTQGASRAIRVVRRDGAAEARIVWSGAGDAADPDGDRIDIDASSTEPLPMAILAAVAARGPVADALLGRSAAASGRFSATRLGDRWSGTAAGRLERVDLSTCTESLAARATGIMDVEVNGVEWRDGRLAACEFTIAAGAGRMDRQLLDALVTTLGCRTGAGAAGAMADRQPAFDALGGTVRIDGRGIRLTGAPRLGGAVALVAGRSLLEPPLDTVPPERLAWLLASPGAVYVPSSGPGTWLMSLLPQGGEAIERTSRAGGPGESGGF